MIDKDDRTATILTMKLFKNKLECFFLRRDALTTKHLKIYL